MPNNENPPAEGGVNHEQKMYQLILQKVINTGDEVRFFHKLFDGYAVTLDATNGELLYAKFPDLPAANAKIERYEKAAREVLSTFAGRCSYHDFTCSCHDIAINRLRIALAGDGGE